MAGLMLVGCSPVCAPQTQLRQVSSSPTLKPPLRDSSCNAEPSSRSLNSDAATSFTLVNDTSETLGLWWLNFQGQRVHYQDIPSGQTRHQGTFVTHPWVVADSSGQCIRLFLVTTPTTITIG